MKELLHDAARAVVIGLPWAFGIAVIGVWLSLRFFRGRTHREE